MPIKTFRGMIADGGQDTVVLHTNNGSMGYRIVKFQLFPNIPGTGTLESTVSIYKVEQATVSTTTAAVDFSDQTLLAASFLSINAGAPSNPVNITTVFDNEIFNQDIYVTHTTTDGSGAVNYYIELEQIRLDLNENTVATLKDIRNLS